MRQAQEEKQEGKVERYAKKLLKYNNDDVDKKFLLEKFNLTKTPKFVVD